MAKVFVPQSSCIFAVTIFILLILSVGLLVFVLKGQTHHENSTSKSGHIKDSSTVPKGSTHTPSPQTAPKVLETRPTAGQPDLGQTTESSKPEINPWEDFRLPKYIIPLHYDLLLHPNIPNDTFTGDVNITVNVTRSTKFFVVHAYRLVIKDSKVFEYRSSEEYGVSRSFLYDPHEYFVVETEKVVEPGIYKLYFSFHGSLVGSIVGFYKSRYTDRNNQTRYLATSKFQPTYARRAFPCHDEPSFKSTFTVSLVHEPGYIALSNMPVDETKSLSDSELLTTKFQTSVPMVTYLACFIVCDFEYVRTATSAGKEFRVYSAPDQVNKTLYSLKFGARVLEYFENYFGIDYPLPKQDMVAIPDFVSGAMEHWGVITFRETNLLYDKESSSPQNKQRVSTVISHEMTHMWFGNLVTMEWWDDLWLNEGFASYVEYKGVHEQHPEWDMLSQFVTEDVQPVMDLDSTMSSHPIVQPVTHPDEITEIFDDISYGKGASVLRMLEFFVGEENFQKGISHFLKKYQFKNAKTADLWAELSEVCGYQGNHTIASVMKTWTEQMGFPFIAVKRLQSSQNSSVFEAKQKRFVKNDVLYRQNCNTSNEYIWSVPLSYVTENGQTDIIWIHDNKKMEFVVPLKSKEWVKFNVNQTGYYLVNYEKDDWDKLIELLMTNHELLSPSDRSSLLFDSFLLAEAGHIPFDVFLSMSMYLKNESHLVPWETAYHSFVYLCQLLEYTDVNILLKSYIKDLTNVRYKKLGWRTAENHLDNLLRTTIIGLACHSGNQDCLSDAAQLFQNWTQGQEIPSSLRTLVYHYGMSEIGQEEHWNFMWNKYLSEESPSERKTLLYGLAHVRVPNLIHRYLEYAMDDQKIRRQDFFTILNYIAGNPVGRPFVWNFLRENWTFLVDRFTLNDRYLGLAVKKICSYFTSEHELQQMKSFFSKYPDAGAGKRRRQQALENVQNNIKWLKTYKDDVKTWLEIEGTAPWYYHRLPTYIIPEHYDLVIYPMLDKDVFNGTVDITVSLQKPSDYILVHAVELNISNSEIKLIEDGSVMKLAEEFRYEDNDYWVMKPEKKLQMGRYKLHFEFKGPLTVSLKGLYKSSYVNPETMETRYLATTQFQAISARKAFPCFDEPAFKSTFSVRVIHDSDHYALSNTAVENVVELDNGLLETEFEKSFPMVTYLVVVVVCDFKYKETITEKGVKLRVYAAPHQIDKVDYALNVGSRILTYFETYFDVPFPLKKLDMIAIPDFGAGGMENWGVITYAERRLLCRNDSSVSSRNQAAAIISHELAHMVILKRWENVAAAILYFPPWFCFGDDAASYNSTLMFIFFVRCYDVENKGEWFGDLVTIKWWDDLWLNEGFATYISQKGVKHVEPDFDVEDNDWMFMNLPKLDFYELVLLRNLLLFNSIVKAAKSSASASFENGRSTGILSNAMMSDRTVNSHPIVQRVIGVKKGLFDSITYLKGSAVLGMLENYMGEDFRKGVSAYLKQYAYSSARTDDLWTELTNASTQRFLTNKDNILSFGLNVTFIMETWTKQMNYPYITIVRESEENSNYAIQQQRFLEDPATVIYSTALSPYNYVWQIPMTYRTSDSNEAHHLLLNSSDTVTLSLPKSKWIKFNVNFTGFYSVNYDRRDWDSFVDILKTEHEVFSPSDRVNLLFDAFSLARAGHLDYQMPLNMTTYMKNETYHGAWNLVLDRLTQIKRYLKTDRTVKDIIREYIRSLTKDHLRKYTWEDTGNYSERKLRRLMIEAACANGNQEALVMAGSLFKKWMSGTELNPETRDLVYKYGLRVLNDEESWSFLWQRYLSETDPDEKDNLLDALTAVRNVTLLERFIVSARNQSIVRKHDYFHVLESIALNQKGFSLVTSLIFNNWTDLVKIYGGYDAEYHASEVFKLYDTEKDLKKVRDFYKKNKVTKDGQRPRTLAIEGILENIRWHEMHKSTVKDWFQNNVYMPWKNIRLPRHITPSKYNLALEPKINQSGFEGEVEIALAITEPADYILVHENDLKITKTEMKHLVTSENITIDEAFTYKKNNFWVIRLKNVIPEAEYLLKMQFTGKFSKDGQGMGRYWYKNEEDSSERYLIATKFEPTDARKMFPCFDEPDMKAKFKLTVIHESNYTALSNMPEEKRTKLEDDKVESVFEESVIMSTYTLCCVISDFDYIEHEYKGKKIRAYAPPNRISEAHHGLNLTVRILEKYEEFLGVPYVLPKLDSIVVPNFSAPAMEHWGAITYNTQNFLVDEAVAPYQRLLDVDRVISHEIAHQWFGNLVTMKWWNDVWLNEGISTLVMYMPLREYSIIADQLDVRKVSKMMCSDSSIDSHPILQNVSHPPDISDLFDNIIYEKGGAVMKMLQYVLKDDFRIGLSNYLKKYAFKNAETKDLWAEFENVSDIDVNITQMMNTWTCQMGFPYIELKRDGGTLTATQRWFLRKKNDSTITILSQMEKFSPFGFVWTVPLVYKNIATGYEHTLWLKEKNATFHISAMKDDVVKFNPGCVGYYIVKYDDDDYARLSKHLMEDHTIFSVTDRYNLLHDAFLLAETDRLLYDIPMEFTKYMRKEKESLPWTLLRDRFIHFLILMDGKSETVKLLKEYIKNLTSDLYDEIAWNENNYSHFKKWETRSGNCPFTFEDLDFKSTIIDLACHSLNENCLKSMEDELHLWISGKNITADLRFVFSVAIPQVGNHTLWDILYEKFTDSDVTADEKIHVLDGLTSFTESSEIMKTIDVIVEDPTVDSALARTLFRKLGNNPKAVSLLWDYTKDNWSALLNRFEAQNPTAAISVFCDAFKTLTQLGDLFRFLKTVPHMSDYVIDGCIEDIQEAINWSDKYEESLQSWLRWNLS